MVYEALIISTGLGWLGMRAFPPLETDSKRSLCFSWRFHLELLMAGSDNPHFGSPPRGWTRSRAFYQSKVLRMHYWMRKVFEWRQSLRPCGVLKVRGTPCPRFCFKRRNYWRASMAWWTMDLLVAHYLDHPKAFGLPWHWRPGSDVVSGWWKFETRQGCSGHPYRLLRRFAVIGSIANLKLNLCSSKVLAFG